MGHFGGMNTTDSANLVVVDSMSFLGIIRPDFLAKTSMQSVTPGIWRSEPILLRHFLTQFGTLRRYMPEVLIFRTLKILWLVSKNPVALSKTWQETRNSPSNPFWELYCLFLGGSVRCHVFQNSQWVLALYSIYIAIICCLFRARGLQVTFVFNVKYFLLQIRLVTSYLTLRQTHHNLAKIRNGNTKMRPGYTSTISSTVRQAWFWAGFSRKSTSTIPSASVKTNNGVLYMSFRTTCRSSLVYLRGLLVTVVNSTNPFFLLGEFSTCFSHPYSVYLVP